MNDYQKTQIALDCVAAWIDEIGWEGLETIVESRKALIETSIRCSDKVDEIDRLLSKHLDSNEK